MNKDDTLVIERTANGYQVRALHGSGEIICIADTMVFQVMGCAIGTEYGQKKEDTLLGFLAEHFTEGRRHRRNASAAT